MKAARDSPTFKGGHKTVKRWFDRYDGAIVSLQQRPRSGRPSILNQRQVGQLIVDTVRSHNRLAHAVHYPEITRCINQKIDCNISSRTVRRYGKENNIRQKKTIKRTYRESQRNSIQSSLWLLFFIDLLIVNDTSCDAVAKLRRKLHRVSNNEIIFVDETHQNK